MSEVGTTNGTNPSEPPPKKKRFKPLAWIATRIASSAIAQVTQPLLHAAVVGFAGVLGTSAGIFVGPLVGVVVGVALGAIGTILVLRRKQRMGKSGGSETTDDPTPDGKEGPTVASVAEEIHHDILECLTSALTSLRPPSFPEFLRTSVFTSSLLTQLKRLLAVVEVVILEFTLDHQINVHYGVGPDAKNLQDSEPCWVPRGATLDEILADKVKSIYPDGDYARADCRLAEDQNYILIVASSGAFPEAKKPIARYLAHSIETSAELFAAVERGQGRLRRLLAWLAGPRR
jgi:hypothetical protein